jgi:hypothetical protein
VATPGDGADRTRAAAEDPQIDLAATADVCTGIAQLKDASALPAVLERAAAVLDARGIVVWMGAGDELFAAAGWGYEPGIMQRMRPIPRAADNATAAAWRTGELRSVPADASSPGAIVAPMCAPDGCIGALAAEVRNGREHHVGTRAVAAIVAAQLSGVLAAWPAASTAAGRPDAGTAAGDTPVSEGDAAARRRRGP